MTWVQTIDQATPVSQAAMQNPWVNYRLSVQVGFSTTLQGASFLFDGTIMVPSVWNSPPWILRGFPKLITVEEG